MNTNRLLWRVVIALLAFFIWRSPHAQVTTYSYQGAAPTMGGNILDGFIELPAPLAPNSTVTITPDAQGFDDNTGDMLMAEPQMEFTLTTDANGNIVEWNYDGGIYISCDCDLNFTSTNAGDTWTSVKEYYPPGGPPGTISPVPVSTVVGTNPPGKWTTTAGPPMMALQSQLASAQIDNRNLAKGYIDANAIIAELNAALMVCRHSPGAQCAKQ